MNLHLLPDPAIPEPDDVPITKLQYDEYDRHYDERLYSKFCRLFPMSKRREAGWLLQDCAFAILGVEEFAGAFEEMTAFLSRSSSVEYAVDRACRFLRNFPERRVNRPPRLMVRRSGRWVQILNRAQARPGELVVIQEWDKKRRWMTTQPAIEERKAA